MATFVTADAAERLARQKAQKSLGVSASISRPLTYSFKRPGIYDVLKSIPGPRLSTPVNTGNGVSMGGQQNPIQMTVEPTRASVRRAVGDITAIPGVGKPSASPTAADIRSGNWLSPTVDYVGLGMQVLPSLKPAYQEMKNALDSAIIKSLPDTAVPKPIMAMDPYTTQELARELARSRTSGFKIARLPELDSAAQYFGPHYKEIQDYLRLLTESVPNEQRVLETINNLDTLFQKAPRLKKPALVYRGLSRSVHDPDYIDWILAHGPGEIIDETGFLSTSLDRNTAERFSGQYGRPSATGAVMTIDIPQNVPFISPIHTFPDSSIWRPFWETVNGTKMADLGIESELLFPRNAQLEVIANRPNRNILTRMIPPFGVR